MSNCGFEAEEISPRSTTYSLSLGATPLADGDFQFLLWAPNLEAVQLHLLNRDELLARLQPEDKGYHRTVIANIEPGARYVYLLPDGRELPDPVSRYQPDGVHGPSSVVDPRAFQWSDQAWDGLALEDYIFYEIHVGTYTAAGTFDAVISHLGRLRELGITAIEIMPVAQFPGGHNWGYDGVYPFAPQSSYGGPLGLQRLVNAAHGCGLAVVLDVVYNHLGPEGNYLGEYAPYFTKRYQTPWGAAINFDGAASEEVRRFFIENARYWLEVFHIDALRLDAIHGIVDTSAFPFLAELGAAVKSLVDRTNRRVYLIAESDLNDARVLHNPERGGYGLDAQWSDDFHHALHALLTGERAGYYADFGHICQLEAALREGWYFSGQYSAYRQRRHGNSAQGILRQRFVVCIQNHDQVGNRGTGDRLGALVSFEALKLAAGATLLSSFLPLLFMGEEYAETAPFQYFTSHSDASLIAAVHRGRQEESRAFGWSAEIPDPQADATFERSKLNHELKGEEPHRTLYLFYQALIRFRRDHLRIGDSKIEATAFEPQRSLAIRWTDRRHEMVMYCNLGKVPAHFNVACPKGTWQKLLDSADAQWRGPGSALPAKLDSDGTTSVDLQPESFAVFKLGDFLPEGA
jgi:maltooligosyltrehalose trehalohydrolase